MTPAGMRSPWAHADSDLLDEWRVFDYQAPDESFELFPSAPKRGAVPPSVSTSTRFDFSTAAAAVSGKASSSGAQTVTSSSTAAAGTAAIIPTEINVPKLSKALMGVPLEMLTFLPHDTGDIAVGDSDVRVLSSNSTTTKRVCLSSRCMCVLFYFGFCFLLLHIRLVCVCVCVCVCERLTVRVSVFVFSCS